MPADLDRFRSDWNTFADLLRGQLIQRSKTGALSLASANLILSGAASFWESTHTAGGRWLAAYEHRFPEKGGLIRDILLSDMKFTREETAGPDLSPLQYVLPIGAAAAGFLISRGLGASPAVQTAAALLPAAAAFPAVGSILSSTTAVRQKDCIQCYMQQLDRYRMSVESILADTP